MALQEKLFETVRKSARKVMLFGALASAACSGGGGSVTPTPVTSVSFASVSVPSSGQVNTAYTVDVSALASNDDGSVPIDSIVVSDADERKVAYSGNFSQGFTLGSSPGTETVNITAYSHDIDSGPIRQASVSRSVTRTPAPVPPTAAVASLSFNEADSSSVNLASLTTGQSGRTYGLIGVPSDVVASLSGSVLKVKGSDGDINGSRTFKYFVQDAIGSDTADVNVTINPQKDITLIGSEVTGLSTSFQVRINGKNYTLSSTPQKIQLPSGNTTLELVANQASTLDVYDFKFQSGLHIPIHDSLATYSHDFGTNDETVTVETIAKSHSELSGASYDSFKRVWPVIIPPTPQNITLYVYTGSSTGGGILSCDQFDMTTDQLTAVRAAIDTLQQYAGSIWNITKVESTVAPQLLNGTGPGPLDSVQVICPGNASNGIYYRNGGLSMASIVSERGTAPGLWFQEIADWFWGNNGNEDTTDAGYTRSDQIPLSDFPMALDKFVMQYVIPIARDAEKLRAQQGTGHLSF